MSKYVGEFLATLIFIWLGNGVVASVNLEKCKGKNGGWLVVTCAWGFAVTFSIYLFGDISGAHMNPVVTLASAMYGQFQWSMVPGYVIAQMFGAFFGSILVFLSYYNHWTDMNDSDIILACFCTSPAIKNRFANFLTEFLATTLLIFGLNRLGEIKMTEGLAPIITGCFIISIGLSLGSPTGFAMNPARDFGPRIAHSLLPITNKGESEWDYSWIPIVAPIFGGVIGGMLQKLVFSN